MDRRVPAGTPTSQSDSAINRAMSTPESRARVEEIVERHRRQREERDALMSPPGPCIDERGHARNHPRGVYCIKCGARFPERSS